MATRSPTKSAKQTVTISHSSRQSASSSSPVKITMETRSASPLNISRCEEKEELCHLNDRLANYIEHVRSLQLSAEKGARLLASFHDSQRSEVGKVKHTFESEIADLRAALDRASNDKAAAEVGRRHADAIAEEAKRCRLAAENELATVRRQVERAQAQLEKETLMRTELENRVQSLQEELEFQARIHKEEKEQLVKTQFLHVEEEMRAGAEADYESRLAEALRALRAETVLELERYRDQLEADFRVQYHTLQSANSSSTEEASKLRLEMQQFRSRWEDAKTELEVLSKRCEQLQRELDTQRRYYEDEIGRLKDGETDLRRQLAQRLTEFADLMATKVALDQEIMAYRKLLEGEETRCRLSTAARESVFSTSMSSTTAGKGGAKRRRVDVDESTDSEFETHEGGALSRTSASKSASCYAMQRRSLGKVNITEVDTKDSHFVTLHSNTSEDLHIGKWTLKYTADGAETVYKFNRNLILKAGATMKIWSMAASQTHSPPENLVMKNLKFFPGRRIQVVLLDAEDVEQAQMSLTYEETGTTHVHSHKRQATEETITRRHVRTTAQRRRGGLEEDDNAEKCGIM